MTDNNRPLKIFSGLAAATAVLLAGVTYDKWAPGSTGQKAGGPETIAVTVAPDQQKQDTTEKPASTPAPAAEANAPAPAPPAPAPAATPAPPPAPAAVPAPPAPAIKETAKAPEFDTVRVEASGEAIVAGTAVPGSEVTVKLNGQVVGKGVANSEGAWVVVPEKPLAPGAGQLSLEQKAPGAADVIVSEQTVAVAVPEPKSGNEPMVALLNSDEPAKLIQAPDSSGSTVEKQPESTGPGSTKQKSEQPAAEALPPADQSQIAAVPPPDVPVEVPALPNEQKDIAATPPAGAPAETPPKPGETPPRLSVALDSVDYNDHGDIVFSGRAGAGASIRIYVDNKPMGDTASGSDGKWSWTGKSEIAPGNHALRIDQIDASGQVLNRIELPFMREEPERVVAMSAPDQAKQPEAAPPAAQPAEVPHQPAAAPQPIPPTQESAVAANQPAQAPEAPRIGRIVIQPGNNLWKLSRVIYGRGKHYTVIYQANRDQIRNPNRIYPGQIFSTPKATPPEQIDPKRKDPLTPEEGGVKLD
jgi:hypothetical protein